MGNEDPLLCFAKLLALWQNGASMLSMFLGKSAASFSMFLHCRRKTAQQSSSLKVAMPLMRQNVKRKRLSASLQAWKLCARQHRAELTAISYRLAAYLGNGWVCWKTWAARRKLLWTRLQAALALRICRLAARVSSAIHFAG